jgi:CRISPR/Cas system-associated exonuclease Cas4 (RecB family)
MNVHKEGKQIVVNRLNNFALGDKIIGLELKFGFSGSEDIITKEGVPLIGAIDKVIEVDEDTLLIVDYKTSKTAPTADQMKVDTQLSIYDLVASKKWPQYKRIILSLDLLKHDLLYSYRTEEERNDFEEYLKSIHEQMISFTKKDAKPTLNIFCPWCDYREYCSSYKKACKKSDYKFLKTLSLNDEELVAEWKDVKNINKILEERKRELSMVLMEKVKKLGANLTTDTEEVYIRQSSKTTYDVEKVAKIIPLDDLVKIISLNKRGVDNYIGTNPRVKERLNDAKETNFITPFLATRKVKVKKIIKGKGGKSNVKKD